MMIQAVRNDILHYLPAAQRQRRRDNLSLLFNRLCPRIDAPDDRCDGEPKAQQDVIEHLVQGYSPDTLTLYRHAFKLWREDLENDPAIYSFTMKTSAPMVLGKGEQNIYEFSITLQEPWSTPVIPGTAVKGVISSFAHSNGDATWNKGALATAKNRISPVSGSNALNLFGGENAASEDFAGLVDFLPAWWVPTPKSPFLEDIINVHNRRYYQDSGIWPDGTDSPVPNKFIVIKPGESFLFALRGPADWAQLATEILKQAALHQGFGAKTRVGYGRLFYCETDAELMAGIPEMDNLKLAEFYDTHGNKSSFSDAFQKAAERRDYAPELKKLFRKFRPVCCFLAELEEISAPDWKKIKNLHDQYKKNLKSIKLDPGQSEVRQVFNFCRKYAPDPVPAWLAAFAPSAGDFLAGKNANEIADFFDSWKEELHPSLDDFEKAVNELPLNQDDKEFCLMCLEELR